MIPNGEIDLDELRSTKSDRELLEEIHAWQQEATAIIKGIMESMQNNPAIGMLTQMLGGK